jgi:hypothetical protein
MKRGPIGVWFSVALVLFAVSAWVGSRLGKTFAVYRFRYQQRQEEKTYGAERVHLDEVLSHVSAVETVHLFTISIPGGKTPNDEQLFKDVEALKNMSQNPGAPELKPVIDLDLGLAEVKAATIEERNNKTDQAAGYMKSAQAIFQSLGWQDFSEENLRKVEQSELEPAGSPPQVRIPTK